MIDIDKLQKVADRAIEIGAENVQLFSAEEVISVFTRLRQAEKDAARYRSVASILGEASEMLQLLSLSASNVSERNMERVDAVVYEIDLELLKCRK